MPAEQNLAAARRIMQEAWNEGRLAVIDELCAADCVDHDLSRHRDIQGRDGSKQRIGRWRAAVPDMRVTVEDAFASGDEVVVRWTARGTHAGELLGVAPTGKVLEVSGMAIYRFDAEGRIVETWDHWDYLGFMQQLGKVPA
jgi:steroid delta-isomerase-like uncharacterized protein